MDNLQINILDWKISSSLLLYIAALMTRQEGFTGYGGKACLFLQPKTPSDLSSKGAGAFLSGDLCQIPY